MILKNIIYRTWRNSHCYRVDERKVKKIESRLLVGIQLWVPVGIAAKASPSFVR